MGYPRDLRWGTPTIQTWSEGTPGTPLPRPEMGYPPDLGRGTPHPDLRWGIPLPKPGMGYPPALRWGTPPDLRWGTLPDLGWGTPLPRPEMGYPHPDLRWGTPLPGPGMGYPPRPEMGYPPDLGQGTPYPDLRWGTPQPRPEMGYPPYPDLRWGTPSPTSVDRHTDSCQNITYPRTSYAGGKNSNNAQMMDDLRECDFVFAFVFERALLFLFVQNPNHIEVDSPVCALWETHIERDVVRLRVNLDVL